MVDLIQDNPTSSAYRSMVAEMDRQKRASLDYERARREEQEARRTQESRLAGITADNQRRAAEAQFTAQTLQPRVQQAEEQAKQAVTSTRLGELNEQEAENRAFYQTIKLALSGDIATAREIARRSGQNIPDEILRNNQIMGLLDRAAERAQKLYPSSPAKQAKYMEAAGQGIREAMSKGNASLDERMNNMNPRGGRDPGSFLDMPGAEYQMLPGMPEPDQTNAKARRPLLFEVKRDAALELGMSPAEAIQFASGQKVLNDQQLYDMASKIMAREMPTSGMNAYQISDEQRRARTAEIMSELRSMTGGGAIVVPKTSPTPAPTPTGSTDARPSETTPQPPAGQRVTADRIKATYPDAKQAPDGNWYVQKDGRWYRVTPEVE